MASGGGRLLRFSAAEGGARRECCYAFGHAGVGAGAWRRVAASVAHEIDLCAVRLPARESRMADLPACTIDAQVGDVYDAVLRDLEQVGGYSFIGSCAGALTCFEILRRFQQEGVKAPNRLIVVNQVAPDEIEPDAGRALSELSKGDFREWLARETDASNLAFQDGLFDIFYPMLLADYSAARSYRYFGGDTLSCPITVLVTSGSSMDRISVAGWNRMTTGSVSIVEVEDDGDVLSGGTLVPVILSSGFDGVST